MLVISRHYEGVQTRYFHKMKAPQFPQFSVSDNAFWRNENINILGTKARSSIPGVWRSPIRLKLCVEPVFEIEKCQILYPDAKIENNYVLICRDTFFSGTCLGGWGEVVEIGTRSGGLGEMFKSCSNGFRNMFDKIMTDLEEN